jgi:hypothetical protein
VQADDVVVERGRADLWAGHRVERALADLGEEPVAVPEAHPELGHLLEEGRSRSERDQRLRTRPEF